MKYLFTESMLMQINYFDFDVDSSLTDGQTSTYLYKITKCINSHKNNTKLLK